ncbi:MAG: alpha/beta hydrolase family protein [Saprospiraceae bacterium]
MSSDITRLSYFILGSSDTTYLKYDKGQDEITLFDSKQNIINDNYSIRNEFFSSSSGNKLNAWMLKPKNQKPIGTILHFHGSAANILLQYSAIAPLVEEGFQVFTFDYSGYGYSEGKSTRDNVLSDAYSALEYLSKKEEVKNKKLIIYGQSYGGYLASIVSAKHQDKIDGLVIEGAFSSHKAEAKHTVPFLGNIVKDGPIATTEIQKNHKPVLVIHSTEDKKVPIRFGKQIFESANHPKEFFEIDRPHIAGLQYYAEEISDKIKQLMQIN